ncbi:Alkyl hydroperoxide reductase AhpD [Piscirickettsia salmonis]|uniref:Alkyl hydroperoxide reductase AhpD n=1 Tax=Piscirickettsia salmonis TaxID=1238 RepID=A0A1L6TFG2_PISSA|nr:carboxymuconolactone decarboxylase family protein [Piscirickettsia salmonis]AKP72304.1 alkyl hydroperoxide reductase [Piscirickettsia salmonis LF-89 = ATCC VR-1361]ALB24250.1 alkyl hydroperoxide reductase [Piscirickettsia salmonis]ALY04044.1 alkyl hydroperoxide reductase [Piscirickettsia salmonis]ALY04055.1 alkyl hydroperoxide reductase [Piscirickettsia salmonis]AMA43608.1 alkyl hydroperoxide reductase [Piscirickettsia salmonis]
MNIDTLKQLMPSYAKDIKLNLSAVLSEQGAPGLTPNQITSISLASAFATKNNTIITEILTAAREHISDNELEASKLAATLMAMNNIYYRYVHLASSKEVTSLPAKLRMQGIMNPGVDSIDFELYSLAVSAINGCGMCMDSHTKQLLKHNVKPEAIQSSIRIASVIHAASQAVSIEKSL